MATSKYILSIAAGLLLAGGCKDNVEFNEDWCLDPGYRTDLIVDVDLDKTFCQYLTLDSVFPTRSDDAGLVLKYYAAAYGRNSKAPLVISRSSERRIPISLYPGKYNIVAWADYEYENSSKGANFFTDDFSELLLRNKYNYSEASLAKIGYRGAQPVSVAYTTDSVCIAAKPAMGQYRLVATDTVGYKPAKVKVSYSSKIPSAIDAQDGKFNWWWDDISFSCHPAGRLLASDLILSQSTETSVTAVVEVYDENGYLRARKKDLEIPLVNGGITTIRGNFLSVLELDEPQGGGAGLIINPEWESSFDIEF